MGSLILLRKPDPTVSTRSSFSPRYVQQVNGYNVAAPERCLMWPEYKFDNAWHMQTPDHLKTPTAEEAFNPVGLAQRSIRLLKDTFPDLEVR